MRIPVSAIILMTVLSWAAGTATMMGDAASPDWLLPVFLYLQRVSIPAALWATIPLVAVAVWFGAAPGRTRTLSLVGTAVVTFAVAAVIAHLSTTPGGGAVDSSMGGALVTLAAFHLAPLLALFAAIAMASGAEVREVRTRGAREPVAADAAG